MVAQKIDGLAVAKAIREKLNTEIAEKQKTSPRFQPSLTIIQGESNIIILVFEKDFSNQLFLQLYSWRPWRLKYVILL